MAPRKRAGALPPGIRLYKGSYQVRYYDEVGRRRGRSFATLDEAKRHLALVKAGVSVPRTPEGPRFDTWAWEWLETRLAQHASKKSKNASIIQKHLIGDAQHGFGKTPVGMISQMDVQRWVSWMSDRYSSSYVRTAYAILSGILGTAVDADVITKVPTKGIKLPKPERKSECFLSETEIELLVKCLEPFYRPLVFTAGVDWS
jgi:hypothetical protein